VDWELDFNNVAAEVDEMNNTASKTFTPSTSTVDLVAQRSYMRTAAAGAGIEVLDQPSTGETLFYHFDFQVTGTGGPVTVAYRASVDGAPYCKGSFDATPPSSKLLTCRRRRADADS
jgi:hypothetical protein